MKLGHSGAMAHDQNRRHIPKTKRDLYMTGPRVSNDPGLAAGGLVGGPADSSSGPPKRDLNRKAALGKRHRPMKAILADESGDSVRAGTPEGEGVHGRVVPE